MFEEVGRIVRTLPFGTVAFNTPEKLALGESVEIELLLSVTGSIEELQEQITEVGEREGARVRITDEMEARLTGLGFKIEAITVERQAIDPTGVTRWKWQIEPTETGTRHLHLTLTGFIDLERSRRQLTIRTFERTLLIKVTWQDRVMGFFGDNWQWLWTALFVPLLLWWLQRRRARAGPTAPTTSGS